MREWNHSASARWRRLHQAARQSVHRRDMGRVTVLGRTWEFQKRGALHVHVVLGVKTAAELGGAHAYANELAGRRHGHDFGFVDRGRRVGGRRVLEVIPAERAARYLCKYLAPIRGGKLTLSETVTREDVPPQVVYLARSLTTKTGITMRYLRAARRAYFHGLVLVPVTGEVRRPGARLDLHEEISDPGARGALGIGSRGP